MDSLAKTIDLRVLEAIKPRPEDADLPMSDPEHVLFKYLSMVQQHEQEIMRARKAGVTILPPPNFEKDLLLPNITRLMVQQDGSDPLVPVLMASRLMMMLSIQSVFLCAMVAANIRRDRVMAQNFGEFANVMQDNCIGFFNQMLQPAKESSGLLDATGSLIQ